MSYVYDGKRHKESIGCDTCGGENKKEEEEKKKKKTTTTTITTISKTNGYNGHNGYNGKSSSKIKSKRNENSTYDERLFAALTTPIDKFLAFEPDLTIYKEERVRQSIRTGRSAISFEDLSSFLYVKPKLISPTMDKFHIYWTKMGYKGPLVLFLHGVPTNRRQWYGVQKRLSHFCRTISIDMLGMGESSKLRVEKDNIKDFWNWKNDTFYIYKIMKNFMIEEKVEKFYFVADDWGGGIALWYASLFGDETLLGLSLLDPIAFDGYPVNEIQAIGRASGIENESTFRALMGAFDQTLVQIFKTMVYDPNVYNQYNMRAITFPYVETDYLKTNEIGELSADSENMKLNFEAIRVLADRALVLSPSLLMPRHKTNNPRGLAFENIKIPCLVMWGDKDNMMPTQQLYRFKYAFNTDSVRLHKVPNAGHFAAMDNPNDVASELIDWISTISGRSSLAQIFVGFDGIWKGDEAGMVSSLRDMYISS